MLAIIGFTEEIGAAEGGHDDWHEFLHAGLPGAQGAGALCGMRAERGVGLGLDQRLDLIEAVASGFQMGRKLIAHKAANESLHGQLGLVVILPAAGHIVDFHGAELA